jgi:hypothetical protein
MMNPQYPSFKKQTHHPHFSNNPLIPKNKKGNEIGKDMHIWMSVKKMNY